MRSQVVMHVVYNAATNRQTTDVADANGNIGSGNIYDIQNRLLQASGMTMKYAYDAENKRIWEGDGSVDRSTAWGIDGQKLAMYQVSGSYWTLQNTYVYFGGKLLYKGTYDSSRTGDKVKLAKVIADRLGSIGKYYPY